MILSKTWNRNKQKKNPYSKNQFVPRHGNDWKTRKRCGENQGNKFQVFPGATASIASVCVALAGMVPEGLQSSPADPQVCDCKIHSRFMPGSPVTCLAVLRALLRQGSEWLAVPALSLLCLLLATGMGMLCQWQLKEPPDPGQSLEWRGHFLWLCIEKKVKIYHPVFLWNKNNWRKSRIVFGFFFYSLSFSNSFWAYCSNCHLYQMCCHIEH